MPEPDAPIRNGIRDHLLAGELALGMVLRQARTADIAAIVGARTRSAFLHGLRGGMAAAGT